MTMATACPHCAKLERDLEIARQGFRVELLGYFEVAREVRDNALNERDAALARVAELEENDGKAAAI